MFDHLMRKPFDLPLKNGGNVRVKPLSLRDMGTSCLPRRMPCAGWP